MDESGDRRPRVGSANRVLAVVVGAFGVAAFVVTVRTGHGDSALLFVGFPMMFAVFLALIPGRTGHGEAFRITTIALLLAAVALHEGAVCVLLAAPLVYGVVHGVTAVIGWGGGRRRSWAVLPVPLLLLGSVEGIWSGLRIAPDQAVQVVRVVALPAEEVAARIAGGPQPVPVRPIALRVLSVPLPHHVSGDGLDPGERWTFTYHQSSHGPGGDTVAEVAERDPGHVAFTVVADTSITARWFTWRRADLRWRALDTGHTAVLLTLQFRRGLDPVWYFGPLQAALMHQGAAYLLDTLGLR